MSGSSQNCGHETDHIKFVYFIVFQVIQCILFYHSIGFKYNAKIICLVQSWVQGQGNILIGSDIGLQMVEEEVSPIDSPRVDGPTFAMGDMELYDICHLE